MTAKCIKLVINYNKNNELNKNIFFKELRDIQYKTYLACNRALTYLYTNDMQSFIQKDVGIPKQDDKDLYGKSFGAWIENRMNEIMDTSQSGNVAQTRQFIYNRYKNDKTSGLLKGNVSLSQVKRDIPIIIHNKSYKISEENNRLIMDISLFNLSKQKELNVKRIRFDFDKMDSSSKSTLIKIMDGTYKGGSLQLTYNKRKKKCEKVVLELGD